MVPSGREHRILHVAQADMKRGKQKPSPFRRERDNPLGDCRDALSFYQSSALIIRSDYYQLLDMARRTCELFHDLILFYGQRKLRWLGQVRCCLGHRLPPIGAVVGSIIDRLRIPVSPDR